MITHRFPSSRCSGFTLVEMIVTIVIGAILFGMGALVISNGFNAYFAGRGIDSDDWQGRLALERMTRDLRNVRSTADLTTVAANAIAFTDISGNAISYQLAGTTLNLTLNGVTQPLADNIASLTLTYTRSDGGLAATAAQVYYISSELKVSTANVTAFYRGTVSPSNF
jgi:prepilin-type N-terminal cleavage/methylation domain-containing protein